MILAVSHCQAQAPPPYVFYDNGPGCGAQGEKSIESSEECAKAAGALGFNEKVKVGSWSTAPLGCMAKQSSGNWKYGTYFNKIPGKTGQSKYRSICHTVVSTPICGSSPKCITTTGKECVFPFIDRGITYNSCKNKMLTSWCATSVSSFGKWRTWMTWEYCDKEVCSLERNPACTTPDPNAGKAP